MISCLLFNSSDKYLCKQDLERHKVMFATWFYMTENILLYQNSNVLTEYNRTKTVLSKKQSKYFCGQ